MGDHTVVSPDPKEVEVTDTHYRVTVPVKAGETKKVVVALERQMWQAAQINGMPTETLLAYARSRGKLDPKTREAFRKLAELRRELDAVDREVAEAERARSVIFEDQTRVRQNLDSLEGKSRVKDRYLEKLDAQEDQIAALDARRDKLAGERKEKLAELNAMIAKMRI
jgi:chromosome segregation ATPase